MDRRRFLLTSLAGALAAPLAAEAQPAGRCFALACLTPGVRQPRLPTTAYLLPLSLRELGSRGPEPRHRAAIRRGQARPAPRTGRVNWCTPVDLLVAASPVAVRAAKDTTKTIPIVMLLSYSDPVELGFVASFARPGGNITGVVLAAEPTMAAKRLELIKDCSPGGSDRGSCYGRGRVPGTGQWAETAAHLSASSWSSWRFAAPGLRPRFATMAAERADALFLAVASVFSPPIASGLSSWPPSIGCRNL